MTYRMFIDDERFPIGDDWVICCTLGQVKEYISSSGFPTFMIWGKVKPLDTTLSSGWSTKILTLLVLFLKTLSSMFTVKIL